MTGWADGPLLAYDCESTGVNVDTARIVTACAAVVNAGPTRADTWLADPGIDIPEEATAIHGITTAHAREHGRPAAEVVAEIEVRLVVAWAAGLPVVGFNIAYDLTVLDRELRRHHGRALTIGGPVIDPLVIDRHYDRYRRGSRKLDAMCGHYRVNLDGAYDATHDAVAAARLAWRQARTYPELAAMSLEDLAAAQAGWHAEWAGHMREYLIGQGKTDDLTRRRMARTHLTARPSPTPTNGKDNPMARIEVTVTVRVLTDPLRGDVWRVTDGDHVESGNPLFHSPETDELLAILNRRVLAQVKARYGTPDPA